MIGFISTKSNLAYYEYANKIVEIPNDEGTIQYDIDYHGIELGSYGIRHCQFLNWIYGTGCAEPRLSKVMTYL